MNLSSTQINILKRLAKGDNLRMHLSSATWGNGQKCSDDHLYEMEQNGYIKKIGDPGVNPPILFGWAKITDMGLEAIKNA